MYFNIFYFEIIMLKRLGYTLIFASSVANCSLITDPICTGGGGKIFILEDHLNYSIGNEDDVFSIYCNGKGVVSYDIGKINLFSGGDLKLTSFTTNEYDAIENFPLSFNKVSKEFNVFEELYWHDSNKRHISLDFGNILCRGSFKFDGEIILAKMRDGHLTLRSVKDAKLKF